MKKSIIKTIAGILCLAVSISFCANVICKKAGDFFTGLILTDNEASVKQENESRIIILDPGHGGEDPGAIGISGTLEKDINLQLAKILKEVLTFYGFSVIMTRDEDVLLYEEGSSGSKKAQDLKNRLDFSKKYPEAVFVSIHMNKFSIESCKGLQVYYSGNHADSMVIAEGIKNTVKEKVMPENNREIKKATTSIYILNRIEIPAVLIECGFLSNKEEETKLCSNEYRSELAFAVGCSLLQYFEFKENSQGES